MRWILLLALVGCYRPLVVEAPLNIYVPKFKVAPDDACHTICKFDPTCVTKCYENMEEYHKEALLQLEEALLPALEEAEEELRARTMMERTREANAAASPSP